MHRFLLGGLTALALFGLSAASVLAGGFAVTTLDAPLGAMQAGQTYRIGYTIRQHGVTPIDPTVFGGFTTEIVAERQDVKELPIRFEGRPEGALGHYVAEIRLPTAGTWAWQVKQGPFQPQPLGTVVVQPAAAPVVTSAPLRTPGLPVPSFLLPAAIGSSVLLVGALVVALRRESRLALR